MKKADAASAKGGIADRGRKLRKVVDDDTAQMTPEEALRVSAQRSGASLGPTPGAAPSPDASSSELTADAASEKAGSPPEEPAPIMSNPAGVAPEVAADSSPGNSPEGGIGFTPLMLLGGVAAIGLAASSSGSSSSAPYLAPAPQPEPTAAPSGSGAESLTPEHAEAAAARETGEMHLALHAVLDFAGDIRGNIARDGISDERRPEVLGTGKPGSTITVYDAGVMLGSTTVDAEGNWTFLPASDLADGQHHLTAVATDWNGWAAGPTEPFSFTVDSPTVEPVLFGGGEMPIALLAPAPSAPGADSAAQAAPAPSSSVYSNLGSHTVPLFEEKGAFVLL
ncbi:Ig-like domain-containing protein [Variovorax sp. J22R24]|uniref:Ig-like domain-containing protein n=1 Tax=Variovorax gracilis TaxID=3053502 RepID=UPI00257740D0|nr:Ig-like domain-containing protein [Variovorax sp. J22R24]MDM0105330.1 Ig-like domain-containing protein [Variovorax sp. J22R24]